MKLFIILSVLTLSTAISAKTTAKSFGAELLNDVKADVESDDATFRKKSASRAPASVKPTPISMEKEQKKNGKIEKNLNQIGKPSW